MASVPFSSAVATFYEIENNWAPSQMIDGIFAGPPGPGTYAGINGWSVYNYATGVSEGADALLTLASPLPAGTYKLTFKIYQNYYGNPGHILGDFALDYTTAASPTLSSGQTAVSIQSASSLNGTTFSFPSSGELLANTSHNSIGTDTYTVTALVNASSPITGIFLDALKNSSLPGGGPGGQYPNGNFVVSELTLDATLLPTIAINVIAGDDVLNATEAQQPLVITGTSTGVVGQTVTVGLNGEQYTGTVAGDGTWSVTVPQSALIYSLLPNGSYTVTADVSDPYGNAAKEATRNLSVQDRVGLLGDVISGSYDFPTSSSVYGRFNYSVNPFIVNGTVEAILTVDGNITTDVNFNASSLVLTLTAARSESPDPFNGPEFQVISGQPFTSVIGVQSSDPIADAPVSAYVSGGILYVNWEGGGGNVGDTVTIYFAPPPPPTIAINVIDGDGVLNAAEAQQPLIITGTSTGVGDQTVTVGLNGEQYTGTVAGDGTWSVTVPQSALPSSALPDGTYTVTADVSDGYGNAAQEATQSLTVHELGSVIFSSAVASFHEQNSSENWAPSQMIDGIFTGPPDPNGGANGGKNGWSVFNFDIGQAEGAEALLTLASPLPAGEYKLTFKIYQNYYGNPGHILGDFALDYTTAASPTLSSGQTAVSIQSASSLNGTTFSFLSSGELLADTSHNSRGTDTYTVTALVNASSPITGIFLDALKNSSLPGGGPGGQYPNGNFVVSEFTLDASPIPGDQFAYAITGPGSDLFGLIDLNTGLFMSRGPMGQTLAGLGSYNGLIYGGAYHGNTLYRIDTTTGALVPIGTGNLSYGDFGSTTSGLYAFSGDGNLYSINPATGAATQIGPTGLSFGGIVMGMSSGSSTLYLTQNNSLYSLNTTTGSATLVGATNEGESGFGALVTSGGTLFGGAYGASTPDIYTLDPQTGAATFVAASPSTPSAPGVAGLWGLAPANLPLITVNNQAAQPSQQIALTDIFSVSGSGITQYMLWFSWNAGGYPALGTLTNNGVAVPPDRPVILTDLSGLEYTGSAKPGTDKIWLQAYNGSWSNNGSWTEADIFDQGAVAPTVISTDTSVGYGDQLSIASMFDFTGSDVTQYKLWFSWGAGGYPALGTLTNNGVAVPLDQPVTLTSLSGLVYNGSSAPGTDKIWLEAYNGRWSNNGSWMEANITDAGTAPPTVRANNLSVAPAGGVPLSSIFEVTGTAISHYMVWFNWGLGGDPALGALTQNGVSVPLDRPVTLTSLSDVIYTGSDTPGTDKMWLQAYNGQWSNNGNWTEADVTDLNRSSAGQSLTVQAGETVDVASAFTGTATFAADTGTLKLDYSAGFAGTVAGMTGQDTIDFTDIDFAKVQQPTYSGDSSGGILNVTDGTHTAAIAMLGNYLASTFVPSSDGHGGTNVVDPPLSTLAQMATLTPPHT